jgi:hypothetical protein
MERSWFRTVLKRKKKVNCLPGPTGRMAYKMIIRYNVKHEFYETKENAAKSQLSMLFKTHPHLKTRNYRVSRI